MSDVGNLDPEQLILSKSVGAIGVLLISIGLRVEPRFAGLSNSVYTIGVHVVGLFAIGTGILVISHLKGTIINEVPFIMLGFLIFDLTRSID